MKLFSVKFKNGGDSQFYATEMVPADPATAGLFIAFWDAINNRTTGWALTAEITAIVVDDSP